MTPQFCVQFLHSCSLFQFCPGGELFDYIVAKERLTVSFDMCTSITVGAIIGFVNL